MASPTARRSPKVARMRARAWLLVLLAALAQASVLASCKSAEVKQAEQQTPPAPSLPPQWKLLSDEVVVARDFWRTEARLEGKIKALRTVTYEVDGQRVQGHVIVASDAFQADRIYRILANKKSAWAFVRAGETFYEFVGPRDAASSIEQAHQFLKQHLADAG